MSTAFTPPANATWQTLLSELTLAWSERSQALYHEHAGPGNPYTAIDDRDVQAATYWRAIQYWVEWNCLYFIDLVDGPLSADRTAFLYWTLASFRTAAGLNAAGFRRVPEGVEWDGETDPVWSYGHMEAGDIIGPWIFEDLQKAFAMLQHTSRAPAQVNGAKREGGASGGASTGETFAEVLAKARIAWAAASWVSGAWRAYSASSIRYDEQEWYVIEGSRQRANFQITEVATCVPCAIDFYSKPFIPGWVFNDIDGLGFADAVYALIQSLPEDTTATRTTPMLGDISTAPFDLVVTTGDFACNSESNRAVLKWNFTNA